MHRPLRNGSSMAVFGAARDHAAWGPDGWDLRGSQYVSGYQISALFTALSMTACVRDVCVLSVRRVFLQLQQEHGSFDAFVWSFVPHGQPIVNHWTQLSQVPTK